jgi:hypothetical protein
MSLYPHELIALMVRGIRFALLQFNAKKQVKRSAPASCETLTESYELFLLNEQNNRNNNSGEWSSRSPQHLQSSPQSFTAPGTSYAPESEQPSSEPVKSRRACNDGIVAVLLRGWKNATTQRPRGLNARAVKTGFAGCANLVVKAVKWLVCSTLSRRRAGRSGWSRLHSVTLTLLWLLNSTGCMSASGDFEAGARGRLTFPPERSARSSSWITQDDGTSTPTASPSENSGSNQKSPKNGTQSPGTPPSWISD